MYVHYTCTLHMVIKNIIICIYKGMLRKVIPMTPLDPPLQKTINVYAYVMSFTMFPREFIFKKLNDYPNKYFFSLTRFFNRLVGTIGHIVYLSNTIVFVK